MFSEPNRKSHNVDRVSSDDLAPPTVSLRVYTLFREKRVRPLGDPQL